jgi:two-component system sensor histidine kinase DesK
MSHSDDPSCEATAAGGSRFGDMQRQCGGGWRRYLFPGLWLIYLAQTVAGVHKHSHGAAIVVGYLIVLAFMVVYLLALPSAWMGVHRRFWLLYATGCALTAAEVYFAHADAFVFCVYLAVLTIAGARRYALPLIATMAVIAAIAPTMVASWHASVDYATAFTIVLVAFAMYGFFSIIRSNIELAAARAEVARLAADNERSRIARDLHDLLGHSLTTITVKASLARRLAERGESERAVAEITAVEELSRRSLADVRAAVSGYREMSLPGELASARSILRAARVQAKLPGAVDVVHDELQELFGWVVREGITNVVRHARANTCTITLGPNWIEIIDDGRGGSFAAAAAGNGLVGLRERVTASGGTAEIGGCPAGWRIRVEVGPVLEESAAGLHLSGDPAATVHQPTSA